MISKRITWALLFLGYLAGSCVWAGQPLETETARLLRKGKSKIESTFEYQTSTDGKEISFPLLLEFGLTNQLELAVEPVAYTSIRPKQGRHASGPGDLEATLTYLLLTETVKWPAVALAAEVKFPTAKNRAIGSGKTDYTGYVIASKQFFKIDAHLNLGYSILGDPPGIKLNNIFSFALAGEYHLSPRWELVSEFFTSTASVPGAGEGSGTPTSTTQTAELGGGETFGMLGTRWHVYRGITLALGIVYDSQNAVLFRPGVSFSL